MPLLTGLPDDIAQEILYRVTPSLLYSVSHSWRNLIYSPSFPPFLSLYALLSSNDNSLVQFLSFDPISSTWSSLPDPHLLHSPLVLRHPSFIARNFPIQSISIADRLVLLAATTHHLFPALSHPLIFNPFTKTWHHGPSFSTPRRWCATGSVGNSVYLASGVGSSGYTQDLAQSAEKWNVLNGTWEKVASLKHGGRFSREAVEAVGWRGKLCVVNVKGNVVKEGVVYDVEKDTWQEMAEGMLIGWNGPTAAMDEDVIYNVDEVKGILMRYDSERDLWESVVEYDELKGAVQIAARGGKVCVVCGGGGSVVVVDVVARPCKIMVVDPPGDMKFVSVHVLPRTSHESKI
ncbi:hypothetical protein IFM89_003675 [Coptis chinensis]|uniref:F-box/kelch-repeat protein SKIP25 n=1 Tax=Coptis chinensis TaxID=261450 RepID=A0A835IUY4_9MAGN|nr:hypothetical protein IFM89_003675 [Coptis chinensis]